MSDELGPISRRKFLGLSALAGAGAAGLLASGANATSQAATVLPDGGITTPASTLQASSFEGPHQSAVLAEPSNATTFVSFDVIAADRSTLIELFRTITSRLRLLYDGGLPANLGPGQPADDNGILGPVLPRRQIAFVVGLGSSLFDERFGLAKHKPARLSLMHTFPNDHLDPAQSHGDLSLQFLAHDPDAVIHALRDLTKHTRGAMQPRWRLDGFKSPPRPGGTPRNLLGFKDGIANPSTADDGEMNDLVWVGRGGPEPTWTEGGTYQVARVIRMLAEFWDRVSVLEQENMIGRRRDSGAPLDANTEFATPDYKSDPQGLVIPLDAHIRLANPRTDKTAKNRILRRGYNYDLGFDGNGNLNQGLLFTCYQQDIERQFVATQMRLINEPLVDYISPVGGGYFFCPPGLKDSTDYFARGLIEAT